MNYWKLCNWMKSYKMYYFYYWKLILLFWMEKQTILNLKIKILYFEAIHSNIFSQNINVSIGKALNIWMKCTWLLRMWTYLFRLLKYYFKFIFNIMIWGVSLKSPGFYLYTHDVSEIFFQCKIWLTLKMSKRTWPSRNKIST